MPQVTATAKCFPTEDPDRVERAVRNLFPRGQVQGTADGLVSRGDDLERFQELIRNHRILDSARGAMRRGCRPGATAFTLNKQAAYAGRVSFLEERVALGGIEVLVEDRDIEALIDQVAPITVDGEEVRG